MQQDLRAGVVEMCVEPDSAERLLPAGVSAVAQIAARSRLGWASAAWPPTCSAICWYQSRSD